MNAKKLVAKLNAATPEYDFEARGPLHTAASSAELVDVGLIEIWHDDGNEWSYGKAEIQDIGQGDFEIRSLYERNEPFFPEDWESGMVLTAAEIVTGYTDNVR